MGSQWIIGALAFVTLGLVFAFAIYHFGSSLRDPRNRSATANVARGGKGASTQVAEDAPAGSYHDRPLKQRLDDSAISNHPYNPDPAKRGIN